jgi:hypothetical protein
VQPENLESAIREQGMAPVVDLNDPDLPDWTPNVLIMALFGYDEEQVMNMSVAVKIRLLFMHSEINHRQNESGGQDPMRAAAQAAQPGLKTI